MDPTLKLLADLDNPALYVRVDNVPIFCPHTRKIKTPNGIVKVTVTEEDLAGIAANINEAAGEGVLMRLTPGHVQQDKGTPETQQPPVWGYAKNARPGKFGPKKTPGLLATFYYRKDKWEEAKSFPYRSAEFYPDTREITGVALLRRDPELNLGMLAFQKRASTPLTYTRHGRCYHYAMGDAMPDPMDTKADPTVAPDANAPAPDPDYDKFEAHVKRHPVLNYVCSKYAKDAAGVDANVGMDGSQGLGGETVDTGAPGMQPQMQLQREREFLAYQKASEERLAKLEAVNATLQKEKVMLAYERDLDKLLSAGWTFDKGQEIKDAAEMSDAQRASQLRRIQTNYQRDPTGGQLIPTLSGVEGTNGQAKTPRDSTEMHRLMLAAEKKGVRDVEAALALYQRGEINLN